ncbi:hypothetical protein N2152v2_010262 [Parachlorella kessleri]
MANFRGRLSPGQRRVAYDSLGKYSELQQQQQQQRGGGSGDAHRPWAAGSPEGWAHLADYWRTLGAVLASEPGRACDASGDEAVALQERALWDLLALFFLQAQQAQQGLVAHDLARWLRTNAAVVAAGCRAAGHPLPPALVGELREAALPEAHPGYWPCLQRLVCLGWVAEAIDLLGLHSAWLRWEGDISNTADGDPGTAAQVAALEAATLLLRRMPAMETSIAGTAGSATAVGEGREFTSLSEFIAYRRTWQGEALAVLRDAALWQQCSRVAPETGEGLRAALSILAGDESAISAAVKGWVELLVAQLLHMYPSVKPQAELKQLVQRCYSAAGEGRADDFSQLLAVLLEACCDSDAQTVVRACSGFPCSDWFMAHAPLLLAAHPMGASVLGRELAHLGGDQVEFYTLDYAAALMAQAASWQAASWQVAAAYLAWCPVHGRAALESLLGALPLTASDPRLAAKGIAVCRRHGLDRLAEDIQARQGVLSWHSGLLGAALDWLSHASDSRRINAVLAPLAAAVSPVPAALPRAIATAVPEQQEGEARDVERVLSALRPALQSTPSGSANLALLRVHRLLLGGPSSEGSTDPDQPSGGGIGGAGRECNPDAVVSQRLEQAVEELRRLPAALRDTCLPLVCTTLAAHPPGQLAEQDVLQLLAWLQGAEERLGLAAAKGSAPASSSTQQVRHLQQTVGLARLALARSLAASHMA